MDITEQESAKSVQSLQLTIQWMSGDITHVSHQPFRGLYLLKRTILSTINSDVNPCLLSFYTKDADGEFTEYTHPVIKKETHFYAAIREPILHERLDYIYPMGEDDLWRFTYQSSDGINQKQIVVLAKQGDWFCGINEYYKAKQQREPVQWIHTVEEFLEWYMTTKQGMVLGEHALANFVFLWKNRP